MVDKCRQICWGNIRLKGQIFEADSRFLFSRSDREPVQDHQKVASIATLISSEHKSGSVVLYAL